MTHGEVFLKAVAGAAWGDVVPLARVLEVALSPEAATVTQAHAQVLWKELSYLGSNDLAYLLRGLEGVDYPEVVRDVCKHLKISELQPGEEEAVVELNEQLAICKIFADAWKDVDADGRRELLPRMNLDESHLALEGAAVAAAVLAGKRGGSAIYNLSLLVANWVLRAPFGRGLALGSVRKTVPAVVLVAGLRRAKRVALAQTAPPADETPTVDPPTRRQHEKRAEKRAAKPPLLPQQRAKSTRKKVASPKTTTRGAKKSAKKKRSAKKPAAKKKRVRKGL